MKGAQTVLKDSGKKATWDDATGMNYVEYTESGTVHKIWIEDAKSLELKMKAVSDANLGGVAFWKLGLEHDREVCETLIGIPIISTFFAS